MLWFENSSLVVDQNDFIQILVNELNLIFLVWMLEMERVKNKSIKKRIKGAKPISNI